MNHLLLLFFVSIVLMDHQAQAACSREKNDFNQTVENLQQSSPETSLVVLAEVKAVRKIPTSTQASEMDIEVLSVLSGKWEGKSLTAKRGHPSSNASFDGYVPGKKYLLAFQREEDGKGSFFYSQSACGTFSKLIE